jgi:predicted component of type VI protein secretion system
MFTNDDGLFGGNYENKRTCQKSRTWAENVKWDLLNLLNTKLEFQSLNLDDW